LSYGQARRLLIARALVHRPAVLLLDEALDGLDAASSRLVIDLLGRLAAADTSLVMVSHHDDALLSLATHRLILSGGRIAEQGPLS
ncbi:MAG: ATP-binding cassette domain-containing protein, partial [Armatimonadetes bacterium]|nr:ATP-binding cassette domain-containing protein [Armatimonadota bacterium]